MNAQINHPLFIYGTLRDREILSAVLGRDIDTATLRVATAPGWRTVYYPGAVYPALVPAARATAPGLLLEALDDEDLARLDAFEGSQYMRSTIAALCGANAMEVQTYMPSIAIDADAPDWTLEGWMERHRAKVIDAETTEARTAFKLQSQYR